MLKECFGNIDLNTIHCEIQTICLFILFSNFTFLENATTRTFKITYVAQIIFPLDGTAEYGPKSCGDMNVSSVSQESGRHLQEVSRCFERT